MRRLQPAGIYAALVGIPLLGLLPILQLGKRLTPPPALGVGVASKAAAGPTAAVPDLLLLIVQIGVVLIASRVVGLAFRRIGQPQVMGEMAAGIMLGPSLLGWAAPGLSATLFPPASLGFLSSLSQVGLLIFMFLIGLELDPARLRGNGHTAVVTSHASIIAPFFLGASLALLLYSHLAPGGVDFSGFALFMGAAMSVTAFPVLARILTERDLLKTRVGSVAIACAAVDDVTAWCILAIVVVIVRATGGGHAADALPRTLAGSALYLGAMLYWARPLLRRLEALHQRRARLTQDLLTVVLLLALGSAWVTEWLGIHALFGAFLAGAVLPKGRQFVHDLTAKLEDVTVVLLLPLFFAFTGLRTRFGLVSGPELWLYCALVVAVAVLGKFGGSTVAARVTGMPWRSAGAIGVLMNTRGLMELVILNVGLDLGVLSPTLFAMMVLMALATTFMTSPLLQLIYPVRLIAADRSAAQETAPPAVVVAPAPAPTFPAPSTTPAPRRQLPGAEKVPEPALAWPVWTY